MPIPDVPALVEHLQKLVAPTPCGVLICGSATRVSDVPPGDIDIVLVIDEPWIQKSKHRWGNVALDVQIGSARYYIERLRTDQPAGLVEMFATGTIVMDEGGLTESVCTVARAMFKAGPAVVPFQELYERQRAAALLDRARRTVSRSPYVARALAAEALGLVFRGIARSENRWPEAFHAEFRRHQSESDIGALLLSLSSCDALSEIAIVERILTIATGQEIEQSMYGQTPRIRVI